MSYGEYLSGTNNTRKYCRYQCGKEIEFRGKTGPKSTGYFEVDTGEEHTYERCRQLLVNKKKHVPFD